MQVGYFSVGIGPAVNPEFVRTIATTAERLGFSTIWAPEHVVLLEEYARSILIRAANSRHRLIRR